VAVRASVGWLAVVGFLFATRRARSLRVAGRDLAFLLPLGLVGIGAFYLLYFYTVRESTVGTAAILLYSAPAFVVILARMFLKEPLNAAKVCALAQVLSRRLFWPFSIRAVMLDDNGGVGAHPGEAPREIY
jgi:drug/metabolite transporter, DME family